MNLRITQISSVTPYTGLMLKKYPWMLAKLKWSYLSPQKKPLDCQLKLKRNGKRLDQTSSVKYLGIKIDQ